jgi:DNA-binding HxlR family transcriptional regulator
MSGGAIEWDDAGVREAVELLAKRWTLPVLALLWDGPLRRVHIREELAGISDKVLTGALRNLEESGVVTRRFYEAVPPRVEYELTAKGRSLAIPLISIAEWVRAKDG